MKYQIKGLKKKSNETNTILFLIAISGEEKKQDTLLVKDQEMVKSMLNDLKTCRRFDIQGNMTELKGKPILIVSSYTREQAPEAPAQPETYSFEEDDIDKANDAMSECIEAEEDEETTTDCNNEGETKKIETPSIEAVKEEPPTKDVTAQEIKFMPVIGYPIVIENQYFKGYKTLDDLLEEIKVPNKKTLKFY